MKVGLILLVCLCAVALVQAKPGRRGDRGKPGGDRRGVSRPTGTPRVKPTGVPENRKDNPVRKLVGLCKAMGENNVAEASPNWAAVVDDMKTDVCGNLLSAVSTDKADDGDDNVRCVGGRGLRGRCRRGKIGRRGGKDGVTKPSVTRPPINAESALKDICSGLDNMPPDAPVTKEEAIMDALADMEPICDKVDELNAA